MPPETAHALVVRITDWSESSRIATLWSREHGRLRVLAKGGRRLKSSFESSLDLLNVVDVVWLRKSSGSLDLLTEARVSERFPRLRADLPALYSAYYIAELLSDWTEDYDPHPGLFTAVMSALRDLGGIGDLTGQRLISFELTLLDELGYSPALRECAVCGRTVPATAAFSAAAGGVVCSSCRLQVKDALPFAPATRDALWELHSAADGWRRERPANLRKTLRQLLNGYVCYRMGKRPRTMQYLSG